MSSAPLLIVEPRLWTPDGHHFDHALSVARAAKSFDAQRKVVVLSGPQDDALADALTKEPAVDAAIPCFPQRWIGDQAPERRLVEAAVKDARHLRAPIAALSPGRGDVVLFFSTLAIHELLTLGFVRLSMPFRRVRAFGVFRNDPLDADGRLTLNYRRASGFPPLRPVWRAAVRGTMLWTDSVPLQQAMESTWRLRAGLVHRPVPGVWELAETEGGSGPTLDGPVTVGFIGQPRAYRGFDVFALTALAMERERAAGAVRFLAIVQPSSEALFRMSKYSYAFRGGLPGMTIEERWMSSVDFARQMSRADVVWALSEPAGYRRQTSGIVAHALALGEKIVTNRGGWAQLVAGDVPGVAFADLTVESAVGAIRSLLQGGPVERGDDSTRWRAVSTRAAFDAFVGASLSELAG